MERSRPILASMAACAGVAVLVGLSIWLGWNYWEGRHEDQLAWITVGVELIAFAGLACAQGLWRTNWGWALICVLLTILAASWCGFTTFQKISDDGRAQAVTAAQGTLAYRTASLDLTAASGSLRAALAVPRPEGQGPLTITAWETAQGATIARLQHERDDAIVRMNAAMPAISLDWIAVARGIGVEVIKLLGFAAFGLAIRGGRLPSHPPATRPQWAKRSLLAGMATWWAFQGHGQQALADTPSIPETPPQPVERLGDIVSARELVIAAKSLAAQRVGERQIATQLSVRYGQFVSRWQVRKMLGRVAA